MIGSAEIGRRARRLGLQRSHVELDYALNHMIAALADVTSRLVFRGGTALARVYWPDFRLSEDLDFIAVASPEDLRVDLERAVALAADRTALDLSAETGKVRDGRLRSVVRWTRGTVLVDIGMGERPSLEDPERPLDLPYSDLVGTRRKIRVVALAELLGNKWFMLDEREEPRDLFDVWAAISRFGVPMAEIARGHQAKYGFHPQIGQLERARRGPGSLGATTPASARRPSAVRGRIR
jgi:predicted nucleotidyltransferase component of viral defense system